MLAVAYEKAQADYDAQFSTAFLDGKDVGLAEGEARGEARGIALVLNAIAMLKEENADPAQVAIKTGLPLQQILALI